MASLKYLKGVRTRYINTLEKEVRNASPLLERPADKVGSEKLGSVSDCIARIEKYVGKLELQSEKLIASADDDEDLVEDILNEDNTICGAAMNMCCELQKLETRLKDTTKTITKSPHTTAVKLPKLDIIVYSGDKLKWVEFWQSFESSVHRNCHLSNIDKFNYLRTKLASEAKEAIAGLSLSNENYDIAIKILTDRFGNIQETIDLHYNQMINLKPATDSVGSMRSFVDTVDKHLRSLEVLGQDVNQDVFVSVIKSKLPCNAIKHLEMQKGTKVKWTVTKLLELCREYVSACEKAEKPQAEKAKPTWNKYENKPRPYLQ